MVSPASAQPLHAGGKKQQMPSARAACGRQLGRVPTRRIEEVVIAAVDSGLRAPPGFSAVPLVAERTYPGGCRCRATGSSRAARETSASAATRPRRSTPRDLRDYVASAREKFHPKRGDQTQTRKLGFPSWSVSVVGSTSGPATWPAHRPPLYSRGHTLCTTHRPKTAQTGPRARRNENGGQRRRGLAAEPDRDKSGPNSR